ANGRRRPMISKVIVLLVCCAVLAVLPQMVPFYLQGVLAKVWILAIFAMSLDLLLGYTGLFSLGHAAFLGAGGYALGILMVRYGIYDFWIGTGLSVLIPGIVGGLFGIVALRV